MSSHNQFLLYTAPNGAVKVDVFLRDETVWLTQKAMAELFGVKVPAVNKHLKNIFESGELSREATVSKKEIVREEVAREVEFYNLDAIIAVGYRDNSYQATQFRIWATKTLREFILKLGSTGWLALEPTGVPWHRRFAGMRLSTTEPLLAPPPRG